MNTQHISISQLEVLLRPLANEAPTSIDRHLQPWIAKSCGIDEHDVLDYTILHRSLDARKKPDIRFVYKLAVQVRENAPVQESQNVQVHTPEPDREHFLYQLPLRSSLPKYPLVVGTGPAGLMAAYLLALHGCEPIIIDRGFDVEQRQQDIEAFLQTRQLNPESNYLLGEGGAGTYSDGKLYTRVKDPRIRFLLDAYVSARAPRRIRSDRHPHIGSDILPYMVKRLRRQIEAWGGRFKWGVAVQDIIIRQNRCHGVILQNGDTIEAPLTLLACGHSARELIQTLIRHDISYRTKDFQIGCRIEHPQESIDRAQYGWIPPRHLVGAAEYTMTNRPLAKSNLANTTTFCMCPGGEIIAATSHEGRLCTNGMSRFLRNGPYANAGLIVNQPAAHFPSAFEAFQLLDTIERQAFLAGAGKDGIAAYRSPAQSASNFVRGENGVDAKETSYRFGIVPARLDRLLPLGTVLALQDALKYFERLIPRFMSSGTLIGVETRVSSPVRFERDPETFMSSLPGLYLLGEGAGCSGGITSSALDGLRIAETILTGKPAKRKRR